MGLNTAIQTLHTLVQDALKTTYPEVDFTVFSFVIELSKDKKNGDYATNVALQLTKLLKSNPRDIATKLVGAMNPIPADVERVEIAGPGFINFFMKQESLTTVIKDIIAKQADFGKSNFGQRKSYNVEFVSANPTGSLHLGHARQAALGDTLCRILQAAGYDVIREYYVNDAGNQIHNLTQSVIARYHEVCGREIEMPQDGYFGQDIIEIAQSLQKEYGNKFLDDKSNDTYWLFRNYAVQKELDKIKVDLQFFRVKFDVWSRETAIRDRGLVEQSLEILKETGNTYELDGATWFKTTDFGDDKDRVLIKSDKTYTYLTPDIAYHIDKLSRGYDYLINLLGADHHGYVSRLKAAIMALGHNDDKLEVDLVQMVRLIKDGEEYKMSKRSGNAITLRDLCEEVGIDAVRYFFVARAGSSHLDFDLNVATSKNNENPVYYAQYAHARMFSILEQAQKMGITPASEFNLITSDYETDLLKHLLAFQNVIVDASQTRSPYKITNYIQRLAQLFHAFYNSCRVLDDENPTLSAQRLGFVQAIQIVLKNALQLIGVSAPESM